MWSPVKVWTCISLAGSTPEAIQKGGRGGEGPLAPYIIICGRNTTSYKENTDHALELRTLPDGQVERQMGCTM